MFNGLFFCFLSLILGLATGTFRKSTHQRKFKDTIVSQEQNHKRHNRMIVSFQFSHFQSGKNPVVCCDAENPDNSIVRARIINYILLSVYFIAGFVYMIKDIINLSIIGKINFSCANCR